MKAVGSRSFIHSTMQKNELIKEVELSIEDSSVPLWFPNLATQLAEVGWQTLMSELGLTASSYGTARVITGKTDVPLFVFPSTSKEDFGSIEIELLPKEITDHYSDSQIGFYNALELENQVPLNCLSEAINLIKTIPSLSQSVFTLVKSLHLLKLDDDAYDVSFSEPQVPFSIFISIPKRRVESDFLRVAEAIVHEGMHLQLSLIEKIVPLIKSNEQKFYSPWRDEYRNSTGILHALYVFNVIQSFYTSLSRSLRSVDLVYIKKRRDEVASQVSKVEDFSQSLDLTQHGLQLVERLLG